MAYLFNYVAQPWQTQFYLNKIYKDFYKNTPDGLIGNEDCGQMSAWYVLSAMGFYPVTPGNGDYVLGTPVFDKVTIHLENGKDFVVTADRKAANDFYVQSVQLNGQQQTATYILHTDIMKGGKLHFNLGKTPNKQWGVAQKDLPKTAITEHLITPVPYFEGKDKKFKGQASVAIKSIDKATPIYYSIAPLGGSTTTASFKKYTTTFTLDKSATVYAYTIKNGVKSNTIAQDFYKIPEDKIVKVMSKVNPLYTAGGNDALIDGVVGEANYRTGEWQSYEGADFEAIVDLKTVKPVQYVGAHFLQDAGSWIWMPRSVSFEGSVDGINYQPLGNVKNTIDEKDMTPVVKEFGLKTATSARYIRVRAVNHGTIGDWHPGKGGNAHIFIDEIMVK